MTWKQKHKKNKKLIDLYLASFQLEDLSPESRHKLLCEIGRLCYENDMILLMSVQEYEFEVLNYPIQIPSKLQENKFKQ